MALSELQRAQRYLQHLVNNCPIALANAHAVDETVQRTELDPPASLRPVSALELVARALYQLGSAESELEVLAEQEERDAEAAKATERALTKPSKTWESTDFNACVRDCFKHFEAIQSLAMTAVSTEGDLAPHVVALGAFLVELRHRLEHDLVWDEEQESEAAE